MYFGFPRRVHGVLCGYFSHEERVMFENNVSDPLITITSILPGSRWSFPLLRIVMPDAMRSVFYVFAALRIHLYVDDMKLFLKLISFDVFESTRKLHELLGTEMLKCLSSFRSLRVLKKKQEQVGGL